MARYIGPVCRLCRREGEKLFLKGERCYTGKCAVERREGVPGQHARGRRSRSDYSQQLREKQKVKRMYGLLEDQFRGYYESAARSKGVTGSEMLFGLERRLDNVVYRLGFSVSRRHARQFIRHGHVLVNGKRVTIPSYSVSVFDEIEVRDKMKKNVGVLGSLQSSASGMVPGWLSLDKDNVKGRVEALPTREEISQSIQEQLIVELYSR